MHIITRMQTRSGKTYATTTTSSKKKNNIRIKMKVDNVDNRMILRSQTRTGKTNNSGNTYTATTTCSSREKNNIKLEIKVEKVVNRTRETRPTPTPRPISTQQRVPLGFVRPQ